MKTLITPKGGSVRVSDAVSKILLGTGYKVQQEPAIEEIPAPVTKKPAKRTPRKTSTKKEG